MHCLNLKSNWSKITFQLGIFISESFEQEFQLLSAWETNAKQPLPVTKYF